MYNLIVYLIVYLINKLIKTVNYNIFKTTIYKIYLTKIMIKLVLRYYKFLNSIKSNKDILLNLHSDYYYVIFKILIKNFPLFFTNRLILKYEDKI